MSRAHKEIVDKTDVAVVEPNRNSIISRWTFHVKNYVFDLLKAGITPIFIFDGKYINEKSQTQEKRRAEKNKRINEAEELKKKLLSVDPLERTPDMITSLRKKMHHLGYLHSDEKEVIIGILSAIGIPVLRATGEGEQLCAMLCVEGKVDMTQSRDTDLIAFGCPLNITEPGGYIHNPETNQMEESYKCTIFKPILSSLNMEYSTFLDLCIMSGCDFNSNIFKVGIVRSYNLLTTCKSIDNLPEKYDKQCLNHIRCREIFSSFSSEEICQDEIILNIDTDLSESRDRLEMYNAEDWLSDISFLYKNLSIPSKNRIIRKPSLARSRVNLNIKKDTTPRQKSSPKRITSKKISKLSSIQHKNLHKKFQFS